MRISQRLESSGRLCRNARSGPKDWTCQSVTTPLPMVLRYGEAMSYEYKQIYIPIAKKGWRELGSALEDLPAEGWELFMAVPIIELTAWMPGISGSRTSAIVHYFRRPVAELA